MCESSSMCTGHSSGPSFGQPTHAQVCSSGLEFREYCVLQAPIRYTEFRPGSAVVWRMLIATMNPQQAHRQDQRPAMSVAAEARDARSAGGASDESELIAALRAGDEAAFVTLVERYNAGMIRVARIYVRDRSLAEEGAQEAW